MIGPRIDEVREFLQNLDDFAGPLPAGGNHDDIHLRVTADQMLQNRFPGAEGARRAKCPADGNRNEGVDDSNFCD